MVLNRFLLGLCWFSVFVQTLVHGFLHVKHPPVQKSSLPSNRWPRRTSHLFLSGNGDQTRTDSTRESAVIDDSMIDGLLPDTEFQRRQAIHETLRALQTQLPSLLTYSLSEEEAKKAYTSDTRLAVVEATPIRNSKNNNEVKNEIVLASSRKEIVTISNTIVLAVTASNTAGSFLRSTSATASMDLSEARVVDCCLLLDAQQFSSQSTHSKDDVNVNVKVQWEADLLPVLPGRSRSPSSDDVNTKSRSFDVKLGGNNMATRSPKQSTSLSGTSLSRIQGESILTLDSTSDYKVSCHRLAKIRWNGVEVDPVAAGQSLSVLRQTFQSFQQAPFVAQAANIFNQVRDEFIQQQEEQKRQRNKELEPSTFNAPVFVTVEKGAIEVQNKTKIDAADKKSTSKPKSSNHTKKLEENIPIDDFGWKDSKQDGKEAATYPFPGSEKWSEYAISHQMITYFATNVIKALSGNFDDNDQNGYSGPALDTFFATNAKLLTLDGSLLLQNSEKLTNFYKSLASLRRRSFGKWTLKKVSVLDWQWSQGAENGTAKPSIKVQVDYTNDINVPGTPATKSGSDSIPRSRILAQGSDVYVLSPTIKTPGDYDSSIRKGSVVNKKFKIIEVRQKKLILGESSNPQDGVLFMRSLATATETGSIRTFDSSSSFLVDLMQRVANPAKSPTTVSSPVESSSSLLTRSDEAATNVYRIMEALHRELPGLVEFSSEATTQVRALTPANEFMTENVQLLGYLEEPLVRGRLQYCQSIGLAVSSLKAALRSGRVVSRKEPVVRVELTKDGNVRCSLSLFLKLSPMAGLPDAIGLDVAASNRLPPLDLKLVSDYILTHETGLIQKHRFLESRVNGQLTPADVLARWIQRISGNPSSAFLDNEENAPWIRTVRDTVNWLQSLNR